MIDSLEYLKQEEIKLATIIMKNNENNENEVIVALKNELKNICELEEDIEKMKRREAIFIHVFQLTLDATKDKEGFVTYLSEKMNENVLELLKDVPQISSMLPTNETDIKEPEEIINDDISITDEEKDIPSNTEDVIDNEEDNDGMLFEEEDVVAVFSELDKQTQNTISVKIAEIAQHPFTNTEINILTKIANDKVYKIVDILEDNEQIDKYRKAMLLLEEKGIIKCNEDDTFVFLTKFGILFYGIAFKKNPFIIKKLY